MGDTTALGRELRRLRTARGLSLEGLAEASGVSARGIADLELGRTARPRLGTLATLSRGLDLDEAEHAAFLAAARPGNDSPAAGASSTSGTSSTPGASSAAGASSTPGASAERGEEAGGPGPAGLCALPRAATEFVGRSEVLSWLDATATPTAEPSTAEALTAISGGPGSGKTTVAVHFARQIGPACPDGRFFLDLRGVDPDPLPARDAATVLLQALGLPPRDLARTPPAERPARLRALLAERRALVILDNATDLDHVRPLVPEPGTAGRGRVLLTSRHAVRTVAADHRRALHPFTPAEARRFLDLVLGHDRTTAEADATRAVADACGHLPLALRVAANWAATRTEWRLRRLADRLADEHRRLDALAAGDLRVTAAFELSYQRLTTGAARQFRLLSHVAGADFPPALAAALGALTEADAHDLLEELADAGLLHHAGPGRYRFHDLLRLFARARRDRDEPPARSAAARARLHGWLLSTARTAGRQFEPVAPAVPAEPAEPAEPTASPHSHPGPAAPSGQQEAEEWLRAEGANWLDAYRHAAADGRHRVVVDLAESMHWFSDLWAGWPHWVEIHRTAARAAAGLGDAHWEAVHRNYTAWALIECEQRPAEGIAEARAARRLARQAGSTAQEAWSFLYEGWARIRTDEHAPAARWSARARDLFLAADDTLGFLQAANMHTDALHHLGRHEEALTGHRAVLDVLDDPVRRERVPPFLRRLVRATTRYDLARALAAGGRDEEALHLLHQLVGTHQELGRIRSECSIRATLADVLVRVGRPAEAHGHYRYVLEHSGQVPAEQAAEAARKLAALEGN
ncbi:helix-turn-helix domain-containing protein [Kitasatospora purpeofusca]|uniref:helix-turn-helix domain-containing protein n=1 Tax=Kitasatospora purpeofusca TaxID=67352 RepID=UPI0032521B3F